MPGDGRGEAITDRMRLDQALAALHALDRTTALAARQAWEAQWKAERAASANPLLRCGEQYFSQFDEDGILLEILRRLGMRQGRFVEIGVGDGTENNTLILMAHGWSGLWLGGEALAWAPSGRRLTFRQMFVDADNVRAAAGGGPCDVFSLDIDGNDYHVAAVLVPVLQPRVIVVEYNAAVPPPVCFVMPYEPAHRWDGTMWFGASLAAWADLFAPQGYAAVCCSYQGSNAFFVRVADLDRFADVPRELDAIYRPLSFFVPFRRGHAVSTRMLAELERT